MEKTILIGKTNKGNKVEVTIRLENKETVFPHKDVNLKEVLSGNVLSITGGIWNKRKSDYTCCGQIHETLEEMYNNKELKLSIKEETFLWLLKTWKVWHLNDLHAGTSNQDEVLAKVKYPGYPMEHYTWALGVLEQAGLKTDRGYAYGAAWLFQEIPSSVIKKIGEFIAE
jgi:hypothetical protein